MSHSYLASDDVGEMSLDRALDVLLETTSYSEDEVVEKMTEHKPTCMPEEGWLRLLALGRECDHSTSTEKLHRIINTYASMIGTSEGTVRDHFVRDDILQTGEELAVESLDKIRFIASELAYLLPYKRD